MPILIPPPRWKAVTPTLSLRGPGAKTPSSCDRDPSAPMKAKCLLWALYRENDRLLLAGVHPLSHTSQGQTTFFIAVMLESQQVGNQGTEQLSALPQVTQRC